jgi:NitT/TauT family transport system substrate-binding protein
MAKKFLFAALVFSLILSACNVAASDSNQDSLRNIRLPMGFIPNIQYAPFYVAVERGYFAEAGVEIQFDYSIETDGVALVGAGELPFAVVSGEQVLLARAQEIPVVYVTAWFQDYPVAVVAKEGSQIRSAEDLLGRRIGLPGLFGANYVGLRAMLNAVEIAESDVTLDSIGFNQVEALATDQQEIVVGYINNEPLQLRAQGYEVTVIAVADYVQLAANGLISNEDTIANDPELVTAFVAAFLRGLEDAIADPDTAYEISKNYVESLAEADEEVQKKVLALSIDFWQTDRLGASKALAWENMQSVLLDMGLLSNALDLGSAYTNDFIPVE